MDQLLATNFFSEAVLIMALLAAAHEFQVNTKSPTLQGLVPHSNAEFVEVQPDVRL